MQLRPRALAGISRRFRVLLYRPAVYYSEHRRGGDHAANIGAFLRCLIDRSAAAAPPRQLSSSSPPDAGAVTAQRQATLAAFEVLRWLKAEHARQAAAAAPG